MQEACCGAPYNSTLGVKGAAAPGMSKAARLLIEASARAAVGRQFNCAPIRQHVVFPNGGTRHEFDIYVQGSLIGGVSTSPLKVGAGNSNTGGCDRASSELLWLSLWPGDERRIHVLTESHWRSGWSTVTPAFGSHTKSPSTTMTVPRIRYHTSAYFTQRAVDRRLLAPLRMRRGKTRTLDGDRNETDAEHDLGLRS
jgi:hypothetical protein